MNPEKHFNTPDEVEQLIRWMQAPDHQKPDIPAETVAWLPRLQQALRWLTEHGSERKVVWMMYEHYRNAEIGIKYSISTARRDVHAAQRVFHSKDSHNPAFWTGLMLDSLMEAAMSAKRAHKTADYARLSKEIREWLELGVRLNAIDTEPARKITRLISAPSPEEAGFREDVLITERVATLLAQQRARKGTMFIDATDASVDEPTA